MDESPDVELSIVIPVYNSELILDELINRVHASLEKMFQSRSGSYELILVCDNSPDNSWERIETAVTSNSWITGILLRMNAGQHNAIMAGLRSAKGNVIVTMDDDLQHDPNDIPILCEALNHDTDVVFARFPSREHKLWKILGSKFNNWVAGKLLMKPSWVYLSPFRVFSKQILSEILNYNGPYVYIDGLILETTRNIAMVEVKHHSRFLGEGGYGLKSSISLWLKMATNFSIVPLRITSLLGLVFSALGFLLALVFIVQKFTFDVMPIGWSSIIVLILVVGGVQLLALGMLGEYLGRVLLTINSRPQYVVAETIGTKRNSEESAGAN